MLSILIPAYNYNVLTLVQQLHAQADHSNIIFEIIVLDDCSGIEYKDNNRINLLSKCSLVVNARNMGRTQTRKRLAEMSKFSSLLFLDADVMPVDNDFIHRLIPYVAAKTPVVIGGVAYTDERPDKKKMFRYKYGRNREQTTAKQRSAKPYTGILSGNLLVDKQIFLANNFSKAEGLYGMDNVFAHNLYQKKVEVIHIDNPVYHLGLEDDIVFFSKSLESVKNRKALLLNLEGVENINPLLRSYKTLKKYRLVKVVRFFFLLSEPLLKKMVLNTNPNLFVFDIYRLGYLCSLK